MSFKVERKVWSQIKMKKGLACLAYSQKYITLYKTSLEKKKKEKEKKFFLMRFNCVLLLAQEYNIMIEKRVSNIGILYIRCMRRVT